MDGWLGLVLYEFGILQILRRKKIFYFVLVILCPTPNPVNRTENMFWMRNKQIGPQ